MTRRRPAARPPIPDGTEPAPVGRWPAWLSRAVAISCFSSAAAFCIVAGVLPVISCARAIEMHASLVSLHPRDAVTFPLAVAFVLFAAMSTLPDLQIRLRPSRRSSTARRANQAATALFAGAAAAALLVPFAPMVATILLGREASAHGYSPCPAPTTSRNVELVWVRGAEVCTKANS